MVGSDGAVVEGGVDGVVEVVVGTDVVGGAPGCVVVRAGVVVVVVGSGGAVVTGGGGSSMVNTFSKSELPESSAAGVDDNVWSNGRIVTWFRSLS